MVELILEEGTHHPHMEHQHWSEDRGGEGEQGQEPNVVSVGRNKLGDVCRFRIC